MRYSIILSDEYGNKNEIFSTDRIKDALDVASVYQGLCSQDRVYSANKILGDSDNLVIYNALLKDNENDVFIEHDEYYLLSPKDHTKFITNENGLTAFKVIGLQKVDILWYSKYEDINKIMLKFAKYVKEIKTELKTLEKSNIKEEEQDKYQEER